MTADDWRPIETAPKDVTWFLIINANEGPESCEAGRWNPTTFPEYQHVEGDLYRRVEQPSGYDWQGFNNFHRATHWQPIVGPVLATVPADTKPADDRPHCPYTLVPMPVNAEGRGPEMDPAKVVRTDWEVWDELNRCVAVIRETEGV